MGSALEDEVGHPEDAIEPVQVLPESDTMLDEGTSRAARTIHCALEHIALAVSQLNGAVADAANISRTDGDWRRVGGQVRFCSAALQDNSRQCTVRLRLKGKMAGWVLSKCFLINLLQYTQFRPLRTSPKHRKPMNSADPARPQSPSKAPDPGAPLDCPDPKDLARPCSGLMARPPWCRGRIRHRRGDRPLLRAAGRRPVGRRPRPERRGRHRRCDQGRGRGGGIRGGRRG